MKLALLLILSPLASAAVMAPPELATGVFSAPFHSRPNAAVKVYLDFTTVPSTATPEQILQISTIVAAAYSPFNVDVTTELPAPQPNVAWCVIGGTSATPGVAGQSAVGNWTIGTKYNTPGSIISVFAAQVYADGLGNDPRLVGDAVIHEDGHQFGLLHQDDGWMNPTLLGGGEFWGIGLNTLNVPQDSYAILGGELGFAPVPEPPVLMLVAACACGRRKGRI